MSENNSRKQTLFVWPPAKNLKSKSKIKLHIGNFFFPCSSFELTLFQKQLLTLHHRLYTDSGMNLTTLSETLEIYEEFMTQSSKIFKSTKRLTHQKVLEKKLLSETEREMIKMATEERKRECTMMSINSSLEWQRLEDLKTASRLLARL